MTTKNTKNDNPDFQTGHSFPWLNNEVTNAWMRLVNQQIQYFTVMSENMERLAQLTANRMRENFDESARLGKTLVDSGTTLANEYRQVATETAQRTTQAYQKN